MVMARLHVICGNCGSSDSFEYSHEAQFIDSEDSVEQDYTGLVCRNCSTCHDLNDNAKNMNFAEVIN